MRIAPRTVFSRSPRTARSRLLRLGWRATWPRRITSDTSPRTAARRRSGCPRSAIPRLRCTRVRTSGQGSGPRGPRRSNPSRRWRGRSRSSSRSSGEQAPSSYHPLTRGESRMATPTLQNYIDGRWLDAAEGGTFENTNPATGELIANVAKSTVADVDRAVDAARRALDGWRLYPAPKRGEILYRAGEIMLTRKDDLAREMTREMGKVLAESRGDVQEGIDMTYYIAGEGRRQFGDVVPAELPNKWAMSMRHPVGVVAAITPWNFPFAIPTWKIMPALILGNTIVFKPASYTPLLAVRLVEILEEAGLPKGVINLILGSGGDLGDHIVSHPGVDLISFTGSSDTGSPIHEIGRGGPHPAGPRGRGRKSPPRRPQRARVALPLARRLV